MKKIYTLTAAMILCLVLNAQYIQDYLKAANNYFRKGDYASAATYYEKYFSTDKTNTKGEFAPYAPQTISQKTTAAISNRDQAVYNLAESYRLLNYPSKAAQYYQEAIEINKQGFPLAQYHLATMLRAQQQYADAEQQFRAFLDGYTTSDRYQEDAQRELKNLQFIQEQLKKKDLKYYTVTRMPTGVNAQGANYAPSWIDGSTFVFTSTRPEDSASTKKVYTNRIYQASYAGGTFNDIRRVAVAQDKDLHQGVTAATPDGNTVFLTRWDVAQNKKTATIYKSTRSAEGWSVPLKLDAAINAPSSNNQQPAVTPDGKYLMFSSDRSGGLGGFDLWYAPLTDGNPGEPVNMGAVVNTKYDEQAPFYHAASQTLVFSSNGRVGMGGYDFFHSKGTLGSLAEPQNFGYPVNSVKDDIYLASRGSAKNILEDVFLSSDREAACCLEMFYLKKFRPLRQLSGRIVSCDGKKSVAGATITAIDTVSGKTIYAGQVMADGSYQFAMEDYQHLKLQATAPGFFAKSMQTGVPDDMEQEAFAYPDLCLVPEPPKVNETFVVENVYYDFNKAELKEESFPALDEIVRMMETYPAMVIELGAHTDSKGSNAYNLKLSNARAKSVVKYLESKGIDPARLRAKGYGESMPIESNTNPDGSDNAAGREKNRRTEFKVLKNE